MSQEEILNDLKQLLIQGGRTTQHTLCQALADKGYQVNQPRISRLLKKVNAIKITNEEGEMVYRLPHDMAPPFINSALFHLVIDVKYNETTIVVKTSPGSASLIARILDDKQCQIIGTIAGDDTIIVIPQSVHSIQSSYDSICSLLNIKRA